jgi:hypothetical protein
VARITPRLVSVGFGKETVRGTAVAPTSWAPKLEFSFNDRQDKAQNESGFGVIDKISARHTLKEWGEGDLSGAIYRNSFGHILANLFGAAPTTTTVETSARKHTYALAQNNSHLTHTIAIDDPNEDNRFSLAMVNTLSIDYVVDDYVKFSASFMSKKSAQTANTVAFAAETKFLPKHAVIKTAATGSANLTAASALTNIIAVHLEFNKNLTATQALGATAIEGLHNTDFEVSGSIERYYDDVTFRTYARNNTDRSLRVDLIDTDTIVGAITNPSLRFDFEQVSFDYPEQGDTDGLLSETVNFTGLWNLTAAKTVTAELTNETTSY